MTHNERALELYKEGRNYTQAAKQVAKEYNLTYTDNFRRGVTEWMRRRVDKGIFDECEKVGIDVEKIKHYWYKGKHYSINVKGESDTFKYEDFKEDFIGTVKDLITALSKYHDYDFRQYKGEQAMNKVARNLVDYEAGRTIFETFLGITRKANEKQTSIFDYDK